MIRIVGMTKTIELFQNGHHEIYFVDENDNIIADAYKAYKITHEEYVERQNFRKLLEEKIKNQFNRIFENKICNMKVRFSKKSFCKIVSDKAITKSVVNGFSISEHFETAEKIKEIFENAELLGSYPDRNNDPNVIAMHRLQKEITLSNGNNCFAYLTMKEVKKEGNRFYTMELLLKKYPLPNK